LERSPCGLQVAVGRVVRERLLTQLADFGCWQENECWRQVILESGLGAATGALMESTGSCPCQGAP